MKEEFTRASELSEELSGEQINKDDILKESIIITNCIEMESRYPKGKGLDSDKKNTYIIFEFYKQKDKKQELMTSTGGDVLTKKLVLAKSKDLFPLIGMIDKFPNKEGTFEYYDFVDVPETKK